MKVIRQKSTGKYVYRAIPEPRDQLYRANAAKFVNISLSDLEVVDNPAWGDNDWTNATSSSEEKRLREYPSIEDQLEMLYKDTINGTTTWRDERTKINNKHPK